MQGCIFIRSPRELAFLFVFKAPVRATSCRQTRQMALSERRSQAERRVTATDAGALLARYGNRFDQLPYYLREAIDWIGLVE